MSWFLFEFSVMSILSFKHSGVLTHHLRFYFQWFLALLLFLFSNLRGPMKGNNHCHSISLCKLVPACNSGHGPMKQYPSSKLLLKSRALTAQWPWTANFSKLELVVKLQSRTPLCHWLWIAGPVSVGLQEDIFVVRAFLKNAAVTAT